MPHDLPVIALVRDLIFASKITATAKSAGVEVVLVRSLDSLAGKAGRLLLVDLNLAGAIEAAISWKRESGGTVTGFVSHVDTATIEKARAAGVDRILARSRFVELLDNLLRGRDPSATASEASQL